MLKVGPFDTYKTYLSLKNHFTSKTYDYHKYCGKSRASVQSFYKRKDRFWFEKLARQKDDKEIENFFIANFVSCSDPQTLGLGRSFATEKLLIQVGRRKFNLFLISLRKNLKVFLVNTK